MTETDQIAAAVAEAKSAAAEFLKGFHQFKDAMSKVGLECCISGYAHSVEEAKEIVKETGYPVILRPSFTLGGQGGGIVETEEELREKVQWAIDQSPTNEVLVEESILGWKEYELEVIRDTNNNFIVICSIENIDPMGVHTGDSVTVAPAMTLTDREYQRRDGRLQRTVRGRSQDGSGDRHRNEPPGISFERPRVQGNRLPDRQDRGQAGRRDDARRTRKRHHSHERRLRADHRLHRGQVAALRVRKVPRR